MRAELAFNIEAILAQMSLGDPPPPSGDELNSQAGTLRYLRRGCLIVDLFEKRLWVQGRAAPAPAERRFDLFCALVRHQGPIGRKELLAELWDETCDISIVGRTAMRLREDLRLYPEIHIASDRDGYQLFLTA